ncbi:ead/Ea22-like family protein [Salmonella enterica subsp. enterica]|nr:ead/Ea22-like family protein [Salmonella enterica subsp. enterica]
MSNIDKQALREVAEKATKGPWKVFSDIDTKTFAIHTPRDKRCENVIKWGGFDCQPNAEANAEFIAAFNPKVALALLDEVEHHKFLLLSAYQVQRDFAEELGCAGDNESIMEAIDDLKQRIAELESKNGNLRTIAHEQNELAIKANLDSINDAVEMDSLHKRIAELEAKLSKPVLLPKTNGYWTEQEKTYEEAVTLAKRQVRLAGFNVEEM